MSNTERSARSAPWDLPTTGMRTAEVGLAQYLERLMRAHRPPVSEGNIRAYLEHVRTPIWPGWNAVRAVVRRLALRPKFT
ncbi:MAG: hypothetical protein ACJ8R9_25650 [Steroidobacteraceae bacterium]